MIRGLLKSGRASMHIAAANMIGLLLVDTDLMSKAPCIREVRSMVTALAAEELVPMLAANLADDVEEGEGPGPEDRAPLARRRARAHSTRPKSAMVLASLIAAERNSFAPQGRVGPGPPAPTPVFTYMCRQRMLTALSKCVERCRPLWVVPGLEGSLHGLPPAPSSDSAYDAQCLSVLCHEIVECALVALEHSAALVVREAKSIALGVSGGASAHSGTGPGGAALAHACRVLTCVFHLLGVAILRQTLLQHVHALCDLLAALLGPLVALPGPAETGLGGELRQIAMGVVEALPSCVLRLDDRKHQRRATIMILTFLLPVVTAMLGSENGDFRALCVTIIADAVGLASGLVNRGDAAPEPEHGEGGVDGEGDGDSDQDLLTAINAFAQHQFRPVYHSLLRDQEPMPQTARRVRRELLTVDPGLTMG